MDFISPHPPWLGGKEIQGEPRGTFSPKFPATPITVKRCPFKGGQFDMLPRDVCGYFFEFLSMTKITGPPRWLCFTNF